VTKRRLIESLSGTHSARMLCDILDIAPSTYYYHPQGQDDLSLLSLIEDVLLSFSTYEYRRVTEQLHRSSLGYLTPAEFEPLDVIRSYA
jgi:hypothetical protein